MSHLRILALKARARHSYTRFQRLHDTYDCGTALLKEVSSAARIYANDYNKAMTELRRLDSSCPEFEPL